MRWLEVAAISVLSALVTSGLLAAVLRRVVFHYLDRQHLRATRELEFGRDKIEAYLDSRFGAYPELFEICYRAKLVAEECLKEGDLPAAGVDEFGGLVSHLTEKLVRYRLFLPEDVWKAVHQTKHLCQDLLVWLDVLARVKVGADRETREKALIAAREASTQLATKTVELEDLLRQDIEELARARPHRN
jgi:hypothetical protein